MLRRSQLVAISALQGSLLLAIDDPARYLPMEAAVQFSRTPFTTGVATLGSAKRRRSVNERNRA